MTLGSWRDEDIQVGGENARNVRVLGVEGGVPYFVRGRLGQVPPSLTVGQEHEQVRTLLRELAPTFHFVPEELVLHRVTVDGRGHQHLRFRQRKDGLDVIGNEFLLHVDALGNAYAANGSVRGDLHASGRAQVTPEVAVRVALGSSQTLRTYTLGDPRLVYLGTGTTERLRLAYEVPVEGMRAGLPVDEFVYVSAEDGQRLATHSRIHTVLHRAVSSAENGLDLPGSEVRTEGQQASGDSHADVNYEHLKTVYNCYHQNFSGRDSYDGAGAKLISTVHYDYEYSNAFWNGAQMVFGDGDGVKSGPLGEDMDIVAHELTHAVTGAESGLIYTDESGALNESLSDIFAAFCASWGRGGAEDAEVWKIAEGAWTPTTAGDALRYMDEPTRDGVSRDYFPERYIGDEDSGGVHWNSGIPNLVFKLLSTGGTHPREKSPLHVPKIGIQKAGSIFYEAATSMFTPTTTFTQARTYTEQAALDLYADSEIANSVTLAWLAVGVGAPVAPPSVNILSNGIPLEVSDNTTSGTQYYSLQVPPGINRLTFETSSDETGDGDVDLYVKRGAMPTLSDYDCRPYQSGNDESCSFLNPAADTWFVMLRAYSAYSNVRIKGWYGGESELQAGVQIKELSGEEDSQQHWRMDVPPGKEKLAFTLINGMGDADLYVKFGAPPSLTDYDCRPYSADKVETCSFSRPKAGTWHVMLNGYSAYSSAILEGAF